MSEKELKAFQEILKRQQATVRTSKSAARQLLVDLGILTPKGNFTKSFKPGK